MQRWRTNFPAMERTMEGQMSEVSKAFDGLPAHWVAKWWREIRSRNGTDDARRAQARRLFVQQSGAWLPNGGHLYGEVSPPHKICRGRG
jgi:transposase-like protein